MSRLASLLLLPLLLLLAPVFSEGSEHMGARNVTDLKCPPRNKNVAALKGQTCQRSCEPRVCSKSRLCLCDGECGMSCILSGLRCPWLVMIANAETNLPQDSNMFGDFMEVICNPGFTMADGQKVAMSHCQGDGKWSFTAPCEDVLNHSSLCKPLSELDNGFHEDGPYKIGKQVHYWCNTGYQLEGANTLLCQENQEWSHMAPICHRIDVSCSRPPSIAQATLVAVHKSEYTVGTVIYYLCNRDFYLDGSNRVVCLENGTWSQLPYCRARCPILAKRSRIIYQKRKIWVSEIPDSLVRHGDSVTFFCRSQNKTCSLQAESRCFDGVLKLPDCYDEPTYLQYHLFPKRLVSEIPSC